MASSKVADYFQVGGKWFSWNKVREMFDGMKFDESFKSEVEARLEKEFKDSDEFAIFLGWYFRKGLDEMWILSDLGLKKEAIAA